MPTTTPILAQGKLADGWEAAAENISATIKPYLITTDKSMPIKGICPHAPWAAAQLR